MNPDGVVSIAYRVHLVVTTDRDESPSSEMLGSTADTLNGSAGDINAPPLREPIQELCHREESHLREVLALHGSKPRLRNARGAAEDYRWSN
jgi:hypothetical protein